MPSCDNQRSRCRPLSPDNEDDYNYTMGDLSSLAASFGDGVGADAQYPPAYHGDFKRNVFDQVCSFGLEVSDFFIAICMLRFFIAICILRRAICVQYAYCDAI
jgi:hypothetical protein